MDTNSLNLSMKADDIQKGIAEDVQTKFTTSHYELDKQLPKGKKKINWIIET